MTSNNFIDPSNEPSGMDPVQQRNTLRAGHYASAFSFFGHVALSRYFSQMRKRIMATITSQEQWKKTRHSSRSGTVTSRYTTRAALMPGRSSNGRKSVHLYRVGYQEPPSYGWQDANGTLIKPDASLIVREFFSRLNVV